MFSDLRFVFYLADWTKDIYYKKIILTVLKFKKKSFQKLKKDYFHQLCSFYPIFKCIRFKFFC